MKITNLKYSKRFNLGNYSGEEIGLDGELEQGDILEDCFTKIYNAVHELHRINNPQLFNGTTPISGQNGDIPVKQIQKPQSQEADMIENINSCTELKILESSYKWLVKNKPALQAAYDSQFKKLSNGLVKN